MLRRFLPLALLALFLTLPFSPEADSASGRLCEARGICHKIKVAACSQQVNTTVLNVGATSFVVPTSVTMLSRVAAWGAGGGTANGAAGGANGGGGGAYSEVDNVAVTPGNSLVLSVGVHGNGGAAGSSFTSGTAGGDTSVSYLGSQILLAKGGGQGGFGAGAGGLASSGVGTIKHSGGTGGIGHQGGGAGGGGSGGPDGDGQAGIDGSNIEGHTGGSGGGGDAGLDGAGGTGQFSTPGGTGGTGSKLGTVGSGGGGGGAGDGDVNTDSEQGGTGGPVGGGGGGASQPGAGAGASAAGGSGGDGAVAVVYSICGSGPPPPPPQNSFFVATTGADSNAGTLAAPFLTIGQCQAAMRASPTVKTCTLRVGTYNLGASLDLGTADNGETWQFFSADGVNTAVLDGGGTIDMVTTSCCGGNAGSASNPSNITFNGIKFQNPKDSAFQVNVNNSTFKNMDVGFNHDASEAGGFGPMFSVSGKNNQILQNYVHDTLSQGIAAFAFNANESIDGTVISGNVVIRAVQATNDGGAIYLNMRNTNVNGGHVTVSNNYVRDYGNAGVQAEGIYLDDDASNVTVTGNIVGTPSTSLGNGVINLLELNGGSVNKFTGNIIDLGRSNIGVNAQGPGGTGGTIGYGAPPSPNVISGNIIIANFAGANTITDFDENGQIYDQNPASSAAWLSIPGNFYHNFGGGTENTTGNVVSDSNPRHLTSVQLGLVCTNGIYSITAGSAVLGAPFNFPSIVGGWGPPGFTVPSSTNHSC